MFAERGHPSLCRCRGSTSSGGHAATRADARPAQDGRGTPGQSATGPGRNSRRRAWVEGAAEQRSTMDMERMRDGRGFTLIELLMVIAIVGIIAAMVVHGLLRARIASNEASAISSLRLVNTSQSAFVSTCGGGFFAPSFSVLATPPAGTGEGFISIDLSNDPATKSSYLIAVTPGVVAAVSPTSCNGAASGTLSTWRRRPHFGSEPGPDLLRGGGPAPGRGDPLLRDEPGRNHLLEPGRHSRDAKWGAGRYTADSAR